MSSHHEFNEGEVLHHLKHYLPAQLALKDFIHHNTLHAFQDLHFEEAISRVSKIFGYKTSLNILEYRALYKEHLIREDVLERTIIKRKGKENADEWIHNLFHKEYDHEIHARIGYLRDVWHKHYHVNLDYEVHTVLFKLLGGYLDQGVASWHFPFDSRGFLASVRGLQQNTSVSFVRTALGKELLLDENITLTKLLKILVGDERYFENYLFEQQFAHPGWSGMVAVLEDNPKTLMDFRPISLANVIKFELILEIDALQFHSKDKWKPLGELMRKDPIPLFAPTPRTIEDDAIAIWQEAYEWTYYDSVLAGIQKMKGKSHHKPDKSFQALFCIDDREGSMRQYIENLDPDCETYGTPGFFGVEFYYQPQNSQFYTKVCPAPMTPKYLIREIGTVPPLQKDIHFSRAHLNPLLSYPMALFTGFWSGLMMFMNIFKPSYSVLATSSFSHMGKQSKLSIENKDLNDTFEGLQVGFTVTEMADRVEKVLKSIGLVEDFGGIIYVIGHGGSSVNNTHYAGYDCGACSGRPGSVNARVFSFMANHEEVRKELLKRGMDIPVASQFLGGMHDTTRDEFEFYDEDSLSLQNAKYHTKNMEIFNKALSMNAKERSRRFLSTNTKQDAAAVHKIVKNRSISLFEPRPELNHATNALCIVGRHSLHEGLFLDRRAFSNSYDYSIDPQGNYLFNILSAATPVCGGINLEYYFSRVDNQRLGAGSKLPHNVMGLIGVTNGVEGDLRTGLPLQMIEVHDPIRLLMIVEHYPEVVMEVIRRNPAVYEWYKNEWVILAVVYPETHEMYRFENEQFVVYEPLRKLLDTVEDLNELVESETNNIPVHLIK